MKKPVFKLFWLLLCMLILEGCGQRQGGKALESQASESQRQELISYEIGDAEVTITRCDEAAEGEVVIPDEIEGLPVTSIGGSAFSACGGLTSITIPDSVTSIGDGAFAGCLNLNSVTILDSVTSIGEGAFMVCPRLTSINIPDSVTSIGGGAFFDCSILTSITIPDSVTSIGTSAFGDCSNLTSITIPQAFHSKTQAFRLGLDKLWPDGFSLLDSSSNSPENLTQQVLFYDFGDTEAMLTHCDEVAEGEVVIPDEIEPLLGGLSVTSIGFGAFHNCTNLTSIIIPDSVTSIGDQAFESCRSLTSITIPDSVTSIGDQAFDRCNGLTSIIIPQAFHSEDEASRLGLDKLWPNDFSLPDSAGN